VFQLPIKDYYEKCAGKGERQGGKPPCSKGYVKFFFFGKIRPYKGIEVLLCAAELLHKSGLDFRLSIYGKITYDQGKILKQVETLPEVTIADEFIDYKDVYAIFKQNDIIVLPYLQVTQCGPMLVAYNQNVPVICTDLPGFREYVEDMKSGLLFAPGAENLAERMKVVIQNPALIAEMSEYIKEHIKPRFGMESLAKEYLKNLGKAAPEHGAG